MVKFFNAESAKIDYKNGKTNLTEKCEEKSTPSPLSRPATVSINEDRKFQEKCLTQ